MQGSLKEFLGRLGRVSIAEALKTSYGCAVVFAVVYALVLLFGIGGQWAWGAALDGLGISERVVTYFVVLLVLIWTLKNRKMFLGDLAEVFAALRDAPRWLFVLNLTFLALVLASFKWLPWWLAWAVVLALVMGEYFVQRLDELSRKYAPSRREELENVEVCASAAISAEELRNALDEVLHIAHDYVPPTYSWQEQATEMRDALLKLAEIVSANKEKEVEEQW